MSAKPDSLFVKLTTDVSARGEISQPSIKEVLFICVLLPTVLKLKQASLTCIDDIVDLGVILT